VLGKTRLSLPDEPKMWPRSSLFFSIGKDLIAWMNFGESLKTARLAYAVFTIIEHCCASFVGSRNPIDC
jgi:hypothetical protein